MAGTRDLISRIIPHANGWTRVGNRSILKLIEQGQDELLDSLDERRIFISTDNEGFPPYLHTTAGTYRYEITSANLSATLAVTIGGTSYSVRCKDIKRVFIDTSVEYDYHHRWLGQPYIYSYVNPYTTTDERITVADVKVRSQPALENTTAYIDFMNDPDTTTDRYFCEFTWEAPRLTAETVPLILPTRFYRAMEDYALGRIQEYANGKTNEFMLRFNNYWVPEFREAQRRGATAASEFLPRQVC